MQSSRDMVHITPAEWRWVILFGGALVLLAFLPFLWVAISGVTGEQWQFMGVLNNYRDGATYLSKMVQGAEGSWLVHFWHTSEEHPGVFIQVIYPALGHLSGLIGIPPIALFHVARVVASLIMYMTLYHLAATIWPHTQKIRARRVFFAIVAFGSGLGWLFWPLTGDNAFPDLTIPEIFPFYSSLVNVHFPLALACLALLASVLISAFRPGVYDDPNLNNGGLIAGLLSFGLSLLYPQALLPFGIAAGLYVASYWLQKRTFTSREIRWLLVIVLPALPVAVYYAAIVAYNPVVNEWNQQNFTPAPSLLVMMLGLGVPLITAAPGIVRAIRQFDQDGDRFMVFWLVVIVIAIYLPTNIQRRFAAGMMIPVAYFATRALEGFWFQYINRRWRYRLLILIVPLMVGSYVVLLVLNLSVSVGPFLNRDYAVAFQWLRTRIQPNDVILASEEVSVWIPGWVGTRVVYGHPYETLDAVAKKTAVERWYRGEETAECDALLDNYRVDFIILGPQEVLLGQTNCIDSLTPVFRYGSVTIYEA